MREIMVRGRVVLGGSWIYGYYSFEEGYHIIRTVGDNFQRDGSPIIVEGTTIGQYTGLKDKNGKEICDGDIIKNDRGTILKVIYVDAAFYVEGTDALSKKHVFTLLSDFSMWSEVLGNIYENPELLEQSS